MDVHAIEPDGLAGTALMSKRGAFGGTQPFKKRQPKRARSRTTPKRSWRDGQTEEDLAKWDLGDAMVAANGGPRKPWEERFDSGTEDMLAGLVGEPSHGPVTSSTPDGTAFPLPVEDMGKGGMGHMVANLPVVLESLRPIDVVHQRQQLLDWWKIPGDIQRASAIQGRRPLPGWEPLEKGAEQARLWMVDALQGAELYWVSPEMTQVIETLAPSIPDCLPQPPVRGGFVMFARSVAGTDADNGQRIYTTAFLWDTLTLAVTGSCLAMETYAWRDLVSLYIELNEKEKENWRASMPSRLIPTGGSEWPLESEISDFSRLPASNPNMELSMLEDRKLLSTFWALCSQKIVVETVQEPTRAMWREAKRRGHREPSSVRVIRLREVTRTESGAHRDVEWSHR
ncbi:MAG: hypothetical protein HRJ53_00145, partial [Acidobacteria bacterium Pan2503]|nr:hypothetical protein [Candidatus Acidoferrum panamensis]